LTYTDPEIAEELHQPHTPESKTPGSKLFSDALIGPWYMPFGLPTMLPGDHQTTGLDFDPHILFGNKTQAMATKIVWGVNSIPHSATILQISTNGIPTTTNLPPNQIRSMPPPNCFTPKDHYQLELLDQDITSILCQS